MRKTNFRRYALAETRAYFTFYTYRHIILRDIHGKSVTGNIEIEFAHSQTAQTGLLVLTVDTLHVLCNIPMNKLWTGVRGCEVIENRFLGFSDIDIYTCVCVCVSSHVSGEKSHQKRILPTPKKELRVQY
jgi:hypothetical protein